MQTTLQSISTLADRYTQTAGHTYLNYYLNKENINKLIFRNTTTVSGVEDVDNITEYIYIS